MKDADEDTVFVVEKFEGSIFQQLYKEGCRIVAPPVVIKSATMKQVVMFCSATQVNWIQSRLELNILNSTLRGVVVCYQEWHREIFMEGNFDRFSY